MADETNFTPSWHIPVGINHTPAYQVSGIPYASGSINAKPNPEGPVCIKFPYVTRWIQIINNDTTSVPRADVKVGFSEKGIKGNNYFTIPFEGGAPGLYANSGVMEVKVSEVWLTGSTSVDIVAGLTSILPSKVATSAGPNWSGSSGIG